MFQFSGPQSHRGLPETVLGYGTDLRAFTAFSESSLARHGASHSSYGGPPEENTFFGAPLLIAVGVIVVWLWRRHVAVRALAVVGLVFAVLELGRTVVAGRHTVLTHGPMSVLDHLPLFDSVVPTRFGLALIPVVAVLLAFSVRAAATASDVRVRYGWAVMLVAALLPIAPTPVLAGHAAPARSSPRSGPPSGPTCGTGTPRLWCSARTPRTMTNCGTLSTSSQASRPGRFKGYSSGTWVHELRACPCAISYRAALCGDQRTAHTAACGR